MEFFFFLKIFYIFVKWWLHTVMFFFLKTFNTKMTGWRKTRVHQIPSNAPVSSVACNPTFLHQGVCVPLRKYYITATYFTLTSQSPADSCSKKNSTVSHFESQSKGRKEKKNTSKTFKAPIFLYAFTRRAFKKMMFEIAVREWVHSSRAPGALCSGLCVYNTDLAAQSTVTFCRSAEDSCTRSVRPNVFSVHTTSQNVFHRSIEAKQCSTVHV